MRTMVARLLTASVIAGAAGPAVTLGAPSNPPAGNAPASAGPDLCAKAGSAWSKGVVTQYPWKVISARNGFEVKYCIVRESATNRDQAIVRFTNMAPAPLWLKVRTFYTLSSGRHLEHRATIARLNPREFTAQTLTHTETKPGEHVKEIGFHDMQVSDKELK